MKIFADSYALIEYFKGNKNYTKYFSGENEIVLTKLNLMEVYYSTLVEESEELANKYYDSLLGKCVELPDETIKKAMKLRKLENSKGKKLSYADCIGYQTALDLEINFLTGDNEFKNMEKTIFVK